MNYEINQLEELLKCAKDVKYFTSKYFKIIKYDEINKIELKPNQARLLEMMQDHNRVICGKARQIGASTIEIAYALWLANFYHNKKIKIVTCSAGTAYHMFSNFEQAWSELPGWMKCSYKKDFQFGTEKRLIFENGSSVTFANVSTLKSEKDLEVDVLILDEFAFMDDNEFWKNEKVLHKLGTDIEKVILISTLNKPEGLFYNLWNVAINDEIEWKAIKIKPSLVYVDPKKLDADSYMKEYEVNFPEDHEMKISMIFMFGF